MFIDFSKCQLFCVHSTKFFFASVSHFDVTEHLNLVISQDEKLFVCLVKQNVEIKHKESEKATFLLVTADTFCYK